MALTENEIAELQVAKALLIPNIFSEDNNVEKHKLTFYYK
jgi:hypothetical protein